MPQATVTEVMGQCQSCRKSSGAEVLEESGRNAGNPGPHQLQCPDICVDHNTGSDSALDSGHSSDHCCDACSQHSSESSGKYSLRGSTGSCCGNGDRENAVQLSPSHLQVFDSNEESQENVSRTESVNWGGNDALTPFYAYQGCSNESSICSVNSLAAIYNDDILTRSKSLRVDRDVPLASSVASSRASSPCPGSYGTRHRPKRSISLKIPRRRKRSRKGDTLNLPTIYADDMPKDTKKQNKSAPSSPKSGTIRRALSLLSMNSLVHHHEEGTASPRSPSGVKATRSILRQPRRRHNTVRGMSGMAIDSANQPGYYQGRPISPHSLTCYYPTATSLRQTQSLRHMYNRTEQ
ncbi:unnamed protein product [Meganyctiphanes norvegica]|uniref:Uncharacterized protein n=1 Tax=Meganyctiphanes norvegica TaxID=48144 RepID=A0AAV2RNN1_MEGNR